MHYLTEILKSFSPFKRRNNMHYSCFKTVQRSHLDRLAKALRHTHSETVV